MAEQETPQSAPAPHTILITHADDGMGLLVHHLLCTAAPGYVPAMPRVGGAGPAGTGVLMMDLIQAVVAHECPPDAPAQTTGSLL